MRPPSPANPTTRNPVFDTLFEKGSAAVLEGSHQRDEPPVDGGRWPVTVVARAPEDVRELMESLMREALGLAGPGHFVTGRADSVHLTIRALEPYREAAAASDPVVADWRAAMERTASATAPFRLVLTGLTLTPAGVMAQLETTDDAPWQLMDRLGAELGELAWYEDGWMRRNIWYSSLVHFAHDLADARALVDWVSARRDLEPVEFTVDHLALVRSRYVEDPARGERLMRPESWFVVPFSA